MAEKQGIPEDTPPPAYPGVNASPANAPYPPQPHNAAGAMPPPQNPGYPTTEQQQWQGGPGYPTTAQPQGNSYALPPPYPGPQTYTHDPKSGQTGYPAQPGYPGYQGQPGYQVQPGYPGQPGQPVYQGQPGYPVVQGAPTTMTHQQVTVVAGGGAVHYQAQIIPRDNAGLAWFSCLFCFCPLGLIAIARSNEARRAINEGNYPLAAQLGLEARRYANYAIGTGITLIVVFVVIRIALSMAF